jgi:hypothetical protein
MRREIHRIEPWSAVRVAFFCGLICGFVLGLLNGAMIKYFAAVLGDKMMPPDLMSMVNLSGGAVFALSIILSLISSLIFALLGFTAALCYNLIASLFGGLEIQVTGEERAEAGASSTFREDEEEPGHD